MRMKNKEAHMSCVVSNFIIVDPNLFMDPSKKDVTDKIFVYIHNT
jgi:hypothetical protein